MQINLDELKEGIMGLTETVGSFTLEACTVCLDHQGHQSPVNFELSGIHTMNIMFEWKQEVSQKIRRNWSDLQEATEYGATAIAIICAKEFSGHSVIERSSKGTGFDYWLGEEDELGVFQEKARLEISGILSETASNTIGKRIKEKINQVKKSDSTGLSVHICVTDFKTPKGQYLIR